MITASARTLIADDQPWVLEALRMLLKSEGYQIEAVTSPGAVLEALKTQDFDLLLMDLNYARDTTSGREGLELLSRVRELDSTLPVVVMTAWGSIELAVEALHSGVADFVQKPWENARLLATVRKQVEQGQVRRKAQRLEAETRILDDHIATLSDFQTLLEFLIEHLRETLECSAVAFFARAPREPVFRIAAKSGIDESIDKLKFEPLSQLLTEVFDTRQMSLRKLEKLTRAEICGTLIVPVRLKGDMIGFIFLGERLSGEQYDDQDMRFLASVADVAAAAISNLRSREREQEFQEAIEIQRRFLPGEIPQVRGLEISCAWQPARIIGGDYFDVFKFSESKVGFSIADVVGKGVPAALLMSNLQAAVKSYASEAIRANNLCAKLNQIICGNIAADRFITYFYCLLDATSKKLIYTNAGHNPPILARRDGSQIRLKEGGAVLGVFRDWNYEQREIDLASGDRIVLFTDGVTEARNFREEEFGEERLTELLVENRKLGAGELQGKILEAVAGFGGEDFQDDATLIVIAVE